MQDTLIWADTLALMLLSKIEKKRRENMSESNIRITFFQLSSGASS
jgi:hypothetical protein